MIRDLMRALDVWWFCLEPSDKIGFEIAGAVFWAVLIAIFVLEVPSALKWVLAFASVVGVALPIAALMIAKNSKGKR